VTLVRGTLVHPTPAFARQTGLPRETAIVLGVQYSRSTGEARYALGWLGDEEVRYELASRLERSPLDSRIGETKRQRLLDIYPYPRAGGRGSQLQDPTPEGSCPVLKAWSADIREDLGLDDFYVYDLPSGDLVLGMVVVPKDKQSSGVGSKAMESLVELADHNSRRIWLTPNTRDSDIGTTSRARLTRFYKRFGFVQNKGSNKDYTERYTMYRKPGAGSAGSGNKRRRTRGTSLRP
jgi:GNAT superfamily N-acetyltransferase